MKTYRVRYTAAGTYHETDFDAASPVEAAFNAGWLLHDVLAEELTLHGVDEVAEREHQPDTRPFAQVLDLPRDACADCGRVVRDCECNGVATDLD